MNSITTDGKNDLEWDDLLQTIKDDKNAQKNDPQWQKYNLEYDLVSSAWIAEKCRDEIYAQNLYASLCNNQFQKNDMWPILQDKRWSCSWRYAGGIVADIRGEGDYMDWYCSGIQDESEGAQNSFGRKCVNESVVTDEIKNDLFTLGWLVLPYDDYPE